ncbi:MAG: heparan-alpha-glucosaminide N-acetyltransferase domain-containing protein [Vicinamibacterales bacterium]
MADAAAGHPVCHDLRGPALTERKAWLDALRGVAVIIMVMAHVTDAWTREADRHDDRFFRTVFVNGLAAPLFLLLAGVALAMAAESRARKVGEAEAGRSVHARGWQVFGLAFLFRLQSQLLGWGPLVNLLKVDILNVMGLAMVGAAWIWRLAGGRAARVWAYALATTLFTMLTPIVREAAWPALLPDPIEAYIRPDPNRSTFTLFPWAGFLMAGALAGELIDAARTSAQQRILHAGLAVAAVAGIAGGYAASFLPTIYANSTFWSSSPTFFFIRLGIVVAAVPLAWLIGLTWAPLVAMGRSSLFVYWIHVEMAYGGIALPLKRALSWEAAMLATAALVVLLYVLVLWKNHLMAHRTLPAKLQILAPVLK